MNIEEAQKNYYEKNPKSVFFKNHQKKECAKFVTQNCYLEEMIQNTIMIVPNTNIVFYDYIKFKQYANESIYNILYERLYNLINTVLGSYSSVDLHINLKSFSVSACQRHYQFIAHTLTKNQTQINKINKLVIYHTPKFMDTISKLLHSTVKGFQCEVVYLREDSETEIEELFNPNK